MQYKYLPRSDAPTLMFREWVSEPQRGRPSAKRAVFLGHSQPTHSGMLDSLASGFKAAGWNTFSGDIRGHGLSTDAANPPGHLDRKSGWKDAIEDMRFLFERSFHDVAWEDRLIVVPNITALLTLEVLKEWPDLARNIVMISPPPNQRTFALVGKTFAEVRLRAKKPDEPDEQSLHHLYAFLGAHLKNREHLADVMSADRAVIQQIIDDPLAWPVPTPAYWSNIFGGMLSAWKWPAGLRVREGTRCLMLFGGEDAMLRSGGFLPPIRRFLARIGVAEIAADKVEGARTALFLEEEKFSISQRILNWVAEKHRPSDDLPEVNVAQIATDVLARLGDPDRTNLNPEELVELCYNAIDDEHRWTEIIYRVIYEAERSGDDAEDDLEERISRLMPHWERAFNINRQVMMAATMGVLLQNVVERLQIGVAILDKDNDLLHANSAYAEALVTLYPEYSDEMTNGVGDMRATKRLLTDNVQGEKRSGKSERVLLAGDRPVGYQFFPDALKQTGLQRQGPASILVVRAGGAERSSRESQRVLAELAYGLTAKEAEIALAIAAGKNPDEIAHAMGIQVSTVRGHLKKSFSKMGVHSQSELAARVMSGPLGWLA